MTKWTTMLKKDLRLSTTALLVGFAVTLVCSVIAGLVGEYVYIPLLAAAAFHVFYLPISLFASLRTEAAHLHVWLHNPRPAVSLLLSKLLSGLVTLLISLTVLYSIAGILLRAKFSAIEPYWTDIWSAGWLVFLHAILLSIAIGVLVIFLWSLYHALKHRVGRLTWPILIGIVILTNLLDELFTSSSQYRSLAEWGSIEISFPTFSVDSFPVYVGDYLYQLILVIAMFILSSWIIDKKVEV